MTDENQIKLIVMQTLEGLGFTSSTPNDVQADMLYLRKLRNGADDFNKITRRSCIAVFIPTLLYLLFDSIKTTLGKL